MRSSTLESSGKTFHLATPSPREEFRSRPNLSSIEFGKRCGFAAAAKEARVPIIPMFTENLREYHRFHFFGCRGEDSHPSWWQISFCSPSSYNIFIVEMFCRFFQVLVQAVSYAVSLGFRGFACEATVSKMHSPRYWVNVDP